MRMPEEEGAKGKEDKEDWFEEGGCPESSKVERWSASNLEWVESGHFH